MLVAAMDQAGLNLQNNRGWSALMLGAWHGSEACVRVLLETGLVDVNLRNNDGSTALTMAQQHSRYTIAILLSQAGAQS